MQRGDPSYQMDRLLCRGVTITILPIWCKTGVKEWGRGRVCFCAADENEKQTNMKTHGKVVESGCIGGKDYELTENI